MNRRSFLAASSLALAGQVRGADDPARSWLRSCLRTRQQVEDFVSPDQNAERRADNAGWKLAGAGRGEKLDIARANSASYSLGLLELADVAPADAKDTGLDRPTLINATTLEGVAYSIKVGKLEGENYYVRFPASPHIVLVPKSKLEDTLKKRGELLEKKAGKK